MARLKSEGISLVEAQCKTKSRVKADQDIRNPLALAAMLMHFYTNPDGSEINPMNIFNFDVTGLDATEDQKIKIFKSVNSNATANGHQIHSSLGINAKSLHCVNAVGFRAPIVIVMHHPQDYKEAKFECEFLPTAQPTGEKAQVRH